MQKSHFTKQAFKPLVAISLAFNLSVIHAQNQVIDPYHPMIETGNNTNADESQALKIHWAKIGEINLYKPLLLKTSNKAGIETFVFKFVDSLPNRTDGGNSLKHEITQLATKTTLSFELTSENSKNKVMLGGKSGGIQIGGEGKGKLIVDLGIGEQNRGRSFALKLDSVPSNAVALKGNLEVLIGGGDRQDVSTMGKFEGIFGGNVLGNISLIYLEGVYTTGTKNTLTFKGDQGITGDIKTSVGENLIAFE